MTAAAEPRSLAFLCTAETFTPVAGARVQWLDNLGMRRVVAALGHRPAT